MRTKDFQEQIENIRKHVEIINDELGTVNLKVTAISTDLRWIKYFVGLSLLLALASLGIKVIQF